MNGPERDNRRHRIWITVAFLAAYTFFLAGPGLLPFNRIRPFVLGLPLSMAWIVAWVLLALAVLVWLERGEER